MPIRLTWMTSKGCFGEYPYPTRMTRATARAPEWLVLSDQGVLEGRMRVAVDSDGTIVGFATYLISDGLAELEDLFVDPPRMRQGSQRR